MRTIFGKATDVLLRLEALNTFESQQTAICGHCGATYTTGSQLEVRFFAEHVYGCRGQADMIRFLPEEHSRKVGWRYFYKGGLA